ncbi:MAG: P-II family nitrogen regulator [Planctomycetota bacterium]|nr:MAG: P-II family nitrogen regulator [Planctomycetota bacterium]
MRVPLKRFWVVVKPFKLPAVLEALEGFRVGGLLVSECRGYGRQKGHLELYEGSEYQITFLPKARIEFLASAFEADAIVEAVRSAAATGRIGDGKIFLSDVRRCEGWEGA